MKLTLINGDLLTDLLVQATIVHHFYVNDNWHVLARTGSVFTAYQTDDYFEFKVVARYSLTQPSAIKRFRADYDPQPEPVKPAKPGRPKLVHYKGMTRGEWEKLNGPVPGSQMIDGETASTV